MRVQPRFGMGSFLCVVAAIGCAGPGDTAGVDGPGDDGGIGGVGASSGDASRPPAADAGGEGFDAAQSDTGTTDASASDGAPVTALSCFQSMKAP